MFFYQKPFTFSFFLHFGVFQQPHFPLFFLAFPHEVPEGILLTIYPHHPGSGTTLCFHSDMAQGGEGLACISVHPPSCWTSPVTWGILYSPDHSGCPTFTLLCIGCFLCTPACSIMANEPRQCAPAATDVLSCHNNSEELMRSVCFSVAVRCSATWAFHLTSRRFSSRHVLTSWSR